MPREIIITDVRKDAVNGNQILVSAVFWLAAPANRQKPIAGTPTVVPVATATLTWGYTAAELLSIQNGAVVEFVDTYTYPAGVANNTVTTDLAARYAVAQAALSAASPGSKFIGASWDGTTWTAAP